MNDVEVTLGTATTNSEPAIGDTGRRSGTLSNASYLVVASLIAKGFSFLFVLIATRRLGTALFGNYTAVLAFVGLFGVFTEFGLTTLAVRDVAQDRSLAIRYISNLLLLRLLLSLAAIGLIVVFAHIVMARSLQSAVFLFALAFLPLSVTNTLQVVFQVYERLEYSSVLNMVTSALIAGASILALAMGYHVLALVGIFTALNTLSALVMGWIVYRRFLPWRWQFDLGWWPVLLRSAAPFVMLTLLNVLYSNADMQILYVLSGCGHTQGNAGCTPVGQYGVAMRVLNILVIVFVGSANTVLLPMLNRVATESHEALRRVVRSGTILGLAFGAPTAILTMFYARDALRLLGGHNQVYLNAAPSLAILVWAFPCFLLLGVFYNALYALHQQVVVTAAFAITLIFNVTLNLLLIPHYSYMASSVLTVASELLNGAIVFLALRRALGPLGLAQALIKISLVSLVAISVLLALRSYSIAVGLPLGIAVIVLGFRLVHLLGTTEREILARTPVLGRYVRFL